jgi:hypothetical protein
VLFERVCRENGITAKLIKPYSPTTTGKIERWHQTLRRELLDVAGPFADLPAAQAAVDAWVHTYNTVRPHQALNMATPASRFRPNLQPEPTTVVPVQAPDARTIRVSSPRWPGANAPDATTTSRVMTDLAPNGAPAEQ